MQWSVTVFWLVNAQWFYRIRGSVNATASFGTVHSYTTQWYTPCFGMHILCTDPIGPGLPKFHGQCPIRGMLGRHSQSGTRRTSYGYGNFVAALGRTFGGILQRRSLPRSSTASQSRQHVSWYICLILLSVQPVEKLVGKGFFSDGCGCIIDVEERSRLVDRGWGERALAMDGVVQLIVAGLKVLKVWASSGGCYWSWMKLGYQLRAISRS